MARWQVMGVMSAVWLCGCPSGGPDDTQVLAQPGEACSLELACATGFSCGGDSTCRPVGSPGTATLGDECLSSSFCEVGLVCASDGVCTVEGSPGAARSGEDCAVDSDCESGLHCSSAQVCTGYGVPLWDGADCPAGDAGDFRVLFEVPGEEPLASFYRLPYPNDARVRADGTLDLSGHPSPGALIPALGDVVGDTLAAMESDFHGFGPNQTVFVRLSGAVDYGSISLGLPGQGTVALVDITPGVSTLGERVPTNWQGYNERATYICENYLAIRPSKPLIAGHTYALLLSVGIRSGSGQAAGRDADFEALMAVQAPADARLARAWEAYAPLRDYVANTASFPATALAGAAVFSVGEPAAASAELRDAVWSLAEGPTLSGIVSCDAGASDYADSADASRGCPTTSPVFHELQGLVELPQFQQGSPPFLLRRDGGGIPLGAGTLRPSRVEDVTFSLTVPRNLPMPEAGWPLVIYAHGTGGNYRSAVREGLASRLSQATLADGTEVGFAVLTIDQVQHGPRQHPEAWSADLLLEDADAYTPERLVYNPHNPVAARGNHLQAAADLFALARVVSEGISWDATASPTGEPLAIDAQSVYLLAHSQGSTAASLVAPHEPLFRGLALSGAGGVLLESLLNKRDPLDLAAALRVGLAEPELSSISPMLNLMQQQGEVADPVNAAVLLNGRPSDGGPAVDLLQIYGVGDTYTPDSSQTALAQALRLGQVSGTSAPLDQLSSVTEPVSGNLANGRTGVVRLYEPSAGANGHFVLFDRVEVASQVARFFGSSYAKGTATVEAP